MKRYVRKFIVTILALNLFVFMIPFNAYAAPVSMLDNNFAISRLSDDSKTKVYPKVIRVSATKNEKNVSLNEEDSEVEIEAENPIITEAKKYLGNPYYYGGDDLYYGIDCSHFVWRVLENAIGYQGEYAVACNWIGFGENVGSFENAQAGDILVWQGHVAIYEGNGVMIHAENSDTGICETSISLPEAYQSGFLGVVRFS